MIWNVYLSGEIHTNWRSVIINLADQKKLSVKFTAPVINHDHSDNCGSIILGGEDE